VSVAPKSAMPSGMASMLKMFGVDPVQITDTARKTGKAVEEIAGALGRIERKLDLVMANLGIEEEGNGGREFSSSAGAGARDTAR
jgi:hypothetical protein